MARSEFNFVVTVPDATTGALEIAGGTTVAVAIKYRDASYTTAKVYTAETGSTEKSNPLNPSATTGKVSGWLEDGRYRATISSTTSAFTTINQDFDIRSGGEFKISPNGVPSSPDNPQIFFDDSGSGTPSIKLGSGSATPDIVIQRTGANALSFDATSSGSLSTTLVGNVKLAGSSKTLDVNNSRIQNTASPVVPTDAATKGYVDANNINVEQNSYNGRIHNLPLFTPTVAQASAISANNVQFSKLSVPLNTNVSAIEFVRGATSDSLTFQFGLFAEYNDFDSVRKMVCLSSTEVNTQTWTTATTVELPLGTYNATQTNGSQTSPTTLIVDSTEGFASSGTIHVNGTAATYTSTTSTSFVNVSGLSGSISDNTKVTQFTEEPFYYGDWTLEANFTGNLYAGVVTTGSTLKLLGANVTSPILTATLGLDDEDQFPYFAGSSAPSPGITISKGVTYYRGPDSSFQILGSVANTGSLPSSGNSVNDAYIVGQALYIFDGTSWIEKATVIPFPSTRSSEIPFVRVKV